MLACISHITSHFTETYLLVSALSAFFRTTLLPQIEALLVKTANINYMLTF